MSELIEEGGIASTTERRWTVISERLTSRFSLQRTWTSVKNYWNREGRRTSGLDERKEKQPHRMTTGVQDKQQRRDARQAKRKRETAGQDEGYSQQAPKRSLDQSRKKAKVVRFPMVSLPNTLDSPHRNAEEEVQGQPEQDDIDGLTIRDTGDTGAAEKVDAMMSGALWFE